MIHSKLTSKRDQVSWDCSGERPDCKSPAYRLAPGVRCCIRDDGVELLGLYPLKSILLKKAWKPIFDRMPAKGEICFDQIKALVPTAADLDVEIFFNRLVRKGFLERRGSLPIKSRPFVSIIIPVHNRPEEIKACLAAFETLDYPKNRYEIIVVDDASRDHTPQVIKTFHNVKAVFLEQNRQAAFCRNLAAEKAGGDILAFIDSDCICTPQWLNQLIPAFNDPCVAAVGGQIDSVYKDSALDQYETVKSSLIMGNREKQSQPSDQLFYVPSCNLLVKRDVFLKAGGFNERLYVGEDVDLCLRLQDAGHCIEFRPQGRIYHKHRNRVAAFCKRRFEYGTSEPLLQSLHKNRPKQIYLPPLSILFWAAIVAGIFSGSVLFWGLGALMVLFQSFSANRKLMSRKPASRPNIPAASFPRAVIRGHAAFFYHTGAMVSRYYLVPGLALIFFFPAGAGAILLLHLMCGLVEYHLKKASLGGIRFMVYFTLEQVSYQAGVWYGCARYKNWRAVNPKIIFRKDIP